MKRIPVILFFLTLIFAAGSASAQHRGGWQHQRHGGWGWAGPAVIGAGLVYLATRPVYVVPQPEVYYVEQPVPRVVAPAPQPIVVEGAVSTPLPCTTEQQRVTDPQGRPLYDQYTGRPRVRLVQICPAPVTMQ